MKPHGLIPDEWLLSYAAGALSEAHALLVASHAEYHPELKSKIKDAEDIGGSMMDEFEPSDINQDALDNVFARIDALPADTPVDVTDKFDSNLPLPLANYLDGDLSDLKWRIMGPGMSQVRLWTGPNDERLWLLKARGGTEIPKHDHSGNEMTLILQGGYRVGDKHFTVGDLELADNEMVEHQPIIDEGEDCICLVVTEAPIKLHSFIGRMMQPFIGL
ncbi:ChrR family anti-sigma-E factor [Kordiimonas sp. SCSIO 12610]|uniref:ChrR family anti-sigma-E factor n=1 Tax=Kordiimonas sp. SCSIO 12610 TaxID=2829597 RepID=UPI002108BE3A|nr:ChrR family anti-sigma-E factor [Kordiimonas sp. SCSIO 12610]UTW54357.1 ChrR family anti-sigma-E factor [Kordiimonas sp. SCSIO 12610]